MRRRVRIVYHVLRCFALIQLIPVAYSCIFLLNGWTPMSVYTRTSFADIVVSARVLRTYKEREHRTAAQTYTAHVRVLKVYKGSEHLADIANTGREPRVYNISNFGDKKMCYADVMEGEDYILFLTTFKNRLSAKYDDIFGAAAAMTEYNVNEVLEQLGTVLEDWSSWSTCSASCDGGVQSRQRTCKTPDGSCQGKTFDSRQCNLFVCKGLKDLLSYLGVYKLPLGVIGIQDRPGAFNITQSAKLFSPISSIYDSGLPSDFSIMATIVFPEASSGYLMTLSDLMGKQRLAIQYGSTLVFQYYDQNNLPGEKSPEFDTNIADGRRHQFAISAKDDTISLHVDCDITFEKALYRSRKPMLGSNLMLALGPYFARYGFPFEGVVEQLVMTSDPDAAGLQCNSQFDDTQEQAVKDEGEVNSIDDRETRATTARPVKSSTESLQITSDDNYEWGPWSPCSSTCGKGLQIRSLYCTNNQISVEDCIGNVAERDQVSMCFIQPCNVTCNFPCENGGVCGDGGFCMCSPGYQGDRCQTAICQPDCYNGGWCDASGRCQCQVGYTGSLCETAICEEPCKNGGQCIKPGVCSCPYGYLQPDCSPLCKAPCYNGGRCVRRNKCKCRKGYGGKDCRNPVCPNGCYNGGRCVAPNTCSCPTGYGGSKCHKAVCNPTCENKGKCVYPGICKCRGGYSGATCAKHTCRKTCKNGGVCSGPNRCECPAGFRGRWCHKRKCRKKCKNGGKCARKGRRCRCKLGFFGSRCEKRDCTYEKYVKPYQRTYRMLEREEYTTTCGPWQWKTCVKTRLKYVTVAHTMYRTAYRCV